MCSDNCTVIRYNDIQTCGQPPTCFDHVHRGTQQRKIQQYLIISYTYNNTVKIQLLKCLKTYIVQDVYRNNYSLSCKIIIIVITIITTYTPVILGTILLISFFCYSIYEVFSIACFPTEIF